MFAYCKIQSIVKASKQSAKGVNLHPEEVTVAIILFYEENLHRFPISNYFVLYQMH